MSINVYDAAPIFQSFQKRKIYKDSEYFKIQVLNGDNQMLTPIKLDGGGPVDNKPLSDQLHHFVKKQKKQQTPET